MAEIFSLLAKTVTSGIGWLVGLVSKSYAQPKLEIDVERWLRTRAHTGDVITLDFLPVYAYSIRLNNNSEHHAYHIKLVSCDPPHHAEHLDYYKPVTSHHRECFTLEILDPDIEPVEPGYNSFVLGGVGFVSKGDDNPPLRELRIEYTNSKNRKFYTIFRPFEGLESRNELGRV